MNDQEHIHQLFQKYLSNSCTPEEARELFRLMQAGKERGYIEYLIEKHLQAENTERNPSINAIVEKVFNNLHLEQRPRKNTSKTWFIAAAACIMISLSYIVLQYTQNDKKLDDTAFNDITPGGNKATLTLSDGTTVILDHATSDTIMHKGGIFIQKTAAGELIYHINGTESVTSAMNTISTPMGGQHQITLPDGTRVWLNASSSLTFPTLFDEKERKVSLTGEGYFEVSPYQQGKYKIPFVVETTSQRIEVLGTQFNVNDYADQGTSNTTLLEGSVRIVANMQSIVLQPGQQSRVGNDGIAVVTVDTETVIDWKNGDFLFIDEDLKSIMHKIARWYDVEVVYEKNMPTEGYSGLISRAKNLSEVLHILQLSGELESRIENRTVYLSTKKQ